MKQKNAATSRPFLVGLLFLTSLTLSPSALAEKFSIVILPDTQFYPEVNPNIFYAQTQWIRDNRAVENIIYATHLGDIINGDCNSDTAEWGVADQAMTTLEMDGERVRYGILPGNHDWDPSSGPAICPPASRDRYNGIAPGYQDLGFGPSRFDPLGSNYGNQDGVTNDNNYVLFEFGGFEFIALNFAYTSEMGIPSQAVLDWADGLLSNEYPDRIAIVSSHYMLEENTANSRAADDETAFGPHGRAIYDRLKRHKNLFLMLGGHRRGEAWRIEERTGMHAVHVLLSNYQDYGVPATSSFRNMAQNNCPPPVGGSGCGDLGLMRIVRFDTDEKQAKVTTFAPPIDGRPYLESVKEVNSLDRGVDEMNRSTASNLGFDFNFTGVPRPLPPTNFSID